MSPAASAIADNELQGLMRRFGEQAVEGAHPAAEDEQ